MKKIIAVILIALIAVSSLSITAFAEAPNTGNEPFRIHVYDYEVCVANLYQAARKKTDDSYVYVNYKTDTKPYSFGLRIYAGNYQHMVVDDVTGTPNNKWQKLVTITTGTKGFVRNYAHEKFSGPNKEVFVQLYGQGTTGLSPDLAFDDAEGLWSPDSVYESGTTYYN